VPERDLEPTIKRLTPMLTDPRLPEKINAADSQQANAAGGETAAMVAPLSAASLTQVVGVIIGSPEFQRR